MIYALWEVIDMAANLPTEQERIAFLRKHDSVPLRRMLRYAYDSRVNWILPKDWQPKYTPLAEDQQIGVENMLIKEARTMYLFLSGDDDWNPNVPMEKRQKLFIELLESVLPKDADLILATRERRLPRTEITPDLVRKTFPGLII